ncbi:hypothetical protein O2N63_12090 [Aliiroseovarius sp. KMU-50]|uniref:Calcineurin-like phosphoesterase domain-containing protein n=1 Tax=Aliiroseovarius salicola TaxID=3009082 RepID=A0ABT4W4C2_9RHOB|nr:hypothetical protein [Aliiroseovarius sp. KMU-50]MDA5094825.1 hypothetical protein [Aliiroseovarius sp. KMU-50]
MTDTKPIITHVCISDLHAGALTSLVTTDETPPLHNGKPTASIEETFAAAMCELLGHINQTTIRKPDLVLLGDGLDLSLSPPDRTFNALKGFLTPLYETGSFSTSMPFIPGNHDHSLWTEARFDSPQFSQKGFSHVTPAFASASDVPRSRKLEELLSGLDTPVRVPLYYPNFGIQSQDENRAIVFHHGHFIESMYRMMSDLLGVLSGLKEDDLSCEELEKYNGTWIDFGWSTIGDSGLLGKDVSIAYQLLLTGGASDEFTLRLAQVLKKWLIKNLNLPNTPAVSGGLDMITAGFMDAIVGKFSQLERYDYTQHLSASSIEGLRNYISSAVLKQMREELHSRLPVSNPGGGSGDGHGGMPISTTVVFGHTHKPFEDQLVVEGFDDPVSIYNTGGWILDTSLMSTVEGASVVFVDDQLNTASLRLFEPPVNVDLNNAHDIKYLGKGAVSSTDPTPEKDNNLLQTLREFFEAPAENRPCWNKFSVAAARAYGARQDLILEMARKADADAKKTGGLV